MSHPFTIPSTHHLIHILHHSDSDGRFAGYAAWRYFQRVAAVRDVQFHEVQYNKPFPLDIDSLTKNHVVYILDFSYDRALLDRVYEKVWDLVVLDHHESAEEQLKGATYAHFDVTKSGALLAWEYFFPNTAPPLPCLLVNDFDLWKKQYDNTDGFEAWLRHDRVNQDWEKWDALCYDAEVFSEAILQGRALADQNKSLMANFVNNPDNITLGSIFHDGMNKRITYAVFNGMGILHSQLSEAVYQKFEVDLTISWRVKVKDVAFSVRAPHPEQVSAKAFAMTYGGGGHPASSGFGLPLDKGLDLIKHLMSKA